MPERPISIANRHPHLRLDRRTVVRAIHTLDAHAHKFLGGPPAGELSLVFLTDSALAKLHADFLADPSATDVITFEGDPALGLAGEICVSADAAHRHVQPRSRIRKNLASTSTLRSRRSAPGSFSPELTLYVVHGWLHLAGFDDRVPAKKRAMRRAEARALRLLRSAHLLPIFALRR